jgi:hypothetical protein
MLVPFCERNGTRGSSKISNERPAASCWNFQSLPLLRIPLASGILDSGTAVL